MKKLRVLFLSMVLILGLGSGAMAATSAINNLPGGAGIMQWMAAPDGTHTLINVQNTMATCPGSGNPAYFMVHITFYDYNSQHLFDINWPMTPRDNIGIAVTGDGTNVNLTFEPGEPNEALHTFISAGLGTDNLQFGYATVALTAQDDAAAAACYPGAVPNVVFQALVGNGNADPTDDVNWANVNVVLPDVLFARAAVVFPDGVLGLNGVMLQGFMNMPTLAEDGATPNVLHDFADVWGADAICAVGVDWDNSGTINPNAVTANDFAGIDIHSNELYMTVNYADFVPAGGVAGVGDIALNSPIACSRAGRVKALGSGNNRYWARYNVTPGSTETNLVAIFPANSATAFNPAGLIADNRNFSVLIYDDNEHFVSQPNITGPEVIVAPFNSATNPPMTGMPVIQHTTYTNGEALITGPAPMFGYVYTTVSGTGSDIYPLVTETIPVNIANIVNADVSAVTVGGNDIIQIP